MKKIILIISLCLLSSALLCQNGYKHLGITGGLGVNKSYFGSLSYEIIGNHHRISEIFIDYSQFNQYNISETKAGLAYKPFITKGKNTMLNFRGAMAVGTDFNQFILGVSTGIEFNWFFGGNWTLYLRPSGEYVLWSCQRWRAQALVGLKLPLN